MTKNKQQAVKSLPIVEHNEGWGEGVAEVMFKGGKMPSKGELLKVYFDSSTHSEALVKLMETSTSVNQAICNGFAYGQLCATIRERFTEKQSCGDKDTATLIASLSKLSG